MDNQLTGPSARDAREQTAVRFGCVAHLELLTKERHWDTRACSGPSESSQRTHLKFVFHVPLHFDNVKIVCLINIEPGSHCASNSLQTLTHASSWQPLPSYLIQWMRTWAQRGEGAGPGLSNEGGRRVWTQAESCSWPRCSGCLYNTNFRNERQANWWGIAHWENSTVYQRGTLSVWCQIYLCESRDGCPGTP